MDCAEVSMGKADGRAAKNTRGEKEHWGNGDVKAHGYTCKHGQWALILLIIVK